MGTNLNTCVKCAHRRTPTDEIAYLCERRLEYVKWDQDTSGCVDFTKGGDDGTEENDELRSREVLPR